MKNTRENTPGETKVKLAPGFSKNISFSTVVSTLLSLNGAFGT